MPIMVNVRPETINDLERINEIIVSAFKDHPYSNQKEHLLVAGLRIQGVLDVSLVAEFEGEIVGHIAFSKVTINGEHTHWYGLAPVSVVPKWQNQGIGSKLIILGLDEIKKLGAEGCVVLGEPEYYTRFGFIVDDKLKLEGVPPEYFLALSFGSRIPSGDVMYHKVFAENS